MTQASLRFSISMSLKQKKDLHLNKINREQTSLEKMHSYLEKISHFKFGCILIGN